MYTKAVAEQCEGFVMKADVKCKAMIYNSKNLEFETTKFGWWRAVPLHRLHFRGEGHFPCSRMLRCGKRVLKLAESLCW